MTRRAGAAPRHVGRAAPRGLPQRAKMGLWQKKIRHSKWVCGMCKKTTLYENIMTQRSYASFSNSVAVRHLENTEIGFQNHSSQFPPKIVDCTYEVLQDEIKQYLSTATPFGTPLPFGVSCGKDKSKNRSRQLTGIRFPSFDSNYHLPFIVTAYLGHPACERFTGTKNI